MGEIKSRESYTVRNTNAAPEVVMISVAPDENSEPGYSIERLQITVATPGGIESHSDEIIILD